jgi:nuclease YhcG-like protein
MLNPRYQRLVAIDLKLEEFKPGDKGQIELYLRWLDRHERQPGEEAPIGLILCAGQRHETVELLDLEKSGIRVLSLLDGRSAAGAVAEEAARGGDLSSKTRIGLIGI